MSVDCRGPEFCWDDLCVHSDRGICGVWRNLDDLGDDDYPEDEDEQ